MESAGADRAARWASAGDDGVSRRLDGGARFLVAAVTGVALLTVGWALASGGSGPDGSDGDSGASARREREGTIDGEETPAGARAGRADEAVDGSDLDRPIDRPSADRPAPVEPIERQPGEPLLGESVGFSVLTDLDGELVVIDLDRSAVLPTGWGGGSPTGVSDRFLVTVAPDSDVLSIPLPLGPDLSRPVRLMAGPPGPWFAYVGRGDVWWAYGHDEENGGRMERIDLATGEVLGTIPELDLWLNGLQLASDELVSPIGAGVWREDGDGWQWVADGRILAGSGQVALVVTCPAPDQCTRQWRDARTGAPLELHLPAPGAAVVQVFRDRLMATVTPPLDTVELIDLRTGQVVSSGGAELGSRLPPTVDVSPDGRYVVVGGLDGPAVVRDLDTGASWDLPGEGVDTVVIAPNDTVFPAGEG